MAAQIQLFVSYAHEDQSYLDQLILQLDDLKNDIDVWCDRYINAGHTWDPMIKGKLDAAEIVVFLISEDFLNSSYIKEVEIARVLERSTCKIINVLAKPSAFAQVPELSRYQALPPPGQEIAAQANTAMAWLQVKSGIQKVIADIQRVRQESTSRRDPVVRYVLMIFMFMGIAASAYSYISYHGDIQQNSFNISMPLVLTFASLFGYVLVNKFS